MDTDASAAEERSQEGGFLRSRLFALIRTGVTIAIIAGLVFKLSPGELRDAAADANPALLLAAAALMFVVQFLVVIKWSVLLRARGVTAPFARLARMFAIGNLLSNVLPTAVGGDVYRVYRIQREANARAADVTMSVLYERASGYGAMTCLGALGVAFYYDHALFGLLALGLGALAGLALAVILPRVPFPALRHDHPLRHLLASRGELLALYRMTVFSLVIQVLFISTIAVSGLAFGIHVSWWFWAFATWVVALAMLAPVTLGGFGVRESSFSALAAKAGAAAAQGASVGFTLGALLIVANGAGLLLLELAERTGRVAPVVPAEAIEPANARLS